MNEFCIADIRTTTLAFYCDVLQLVWGQFNVLEDRERAVEATLAANMAQTRLALGNLASPPGNPVLWPRPTLAPPYSHAF